MNNDAESPKTKFSVDLSSVFTTVITTVLSAALGGLLVWAGAIVWDSAMHQKEFAEGVKAELKTNLEITRAELELTKITQESLRTNLSAEIGALRKAMEAQRGDLLKLAAALTNTTSSAKAEVTLLSTTNSWQEYIKAGTANAAAINSQIQNQVEQTVKQQSQELSQQDQQRQQIQQIQQRQQQQGAWKTLAK